ncbi:SIR2 family protein [Serratia proteamaculans]
MDNIKAHLNQIIKANEDESLAIFVGAGVSKSSERENFKMPTWSDLISGLTKDLNIENENDFLKIAQLYFLTFKEHQYYKKIKNFFPDNIPYTKIHETIFEINPHVVITTNWDDILESAVYEKSYFYSIIASDKDLMKSSLDKKVVKMHGDFKNHNIVFKEDDYINYKKNFPLIENYIKSIVSTHTILFIGYSYNDIDLKQIIKWTQSHSEVRPPMFLVTFDETQSQIKYLENHGITTLVVSDETHKVFNNPYSNKLYNFLINIKKPELFKIDEDFDLIEAIHEKLRNLNTIESILSVQIVDILTNCRLVYLYHDDAERAFIEFYTDEIILGDNNSELRDFYDKFVGILKDEVRIDRNRQKIIDVFTILSKADIYGVMLNREEGNAILVSDIVDKSNETDSEAYLNFEFTQNTFTSSLIKESDRKEAYILYFKGHYEQAYSLIEKSVHSCLKNKDYTGLFISLLNKEIILNRLKYDFYTDRERYSHIDEPKIKELYNSLPKSIKNKNSAIYDLVTFNYLNRMSYEASKLLTKYQDANKTKTIFFMDNEKFKDSFVLKNLINFTNLNGCLIDVYSDFKYLVRKLLEVKIAKNSKQEFIELSKVELYSCIRYLDIKTLKIIFKKDDRTWFKFKADHDLLNWLIEPSLAQLKELYISHKREHINFEREMLNIIFMISHFILSTIQEDKVLEQLNLILKSSTHNKSYYDSITEYLTIKYNNSKESLSKDKVEAIVDSVIDKITISSSGLEKAAITLFGIQNLYIVSQGIGIIYDNQVKIDELLSILEKYPLEERVNAAKTIMHGLFRITNGERNKKIKKAMININTATLSLNGRLSYELFLVAIEVVKARKDLHSDIEMLLESTDKKLKYSTEVIRLKGLLNHIVKNIGLKEFSKSLRKVNKITSRFTN